MLTDAEDKQPDEHHGKTRRGKADQQNPEGTQQIRQNRQPPGTQKEEKRGKKDNEESRQFSGQFHKAPLPVTDRKCFVEEIIKGGIDDALGKPEDECRGQEQTEILRQNGRLMYDSF